MSGRQISQATVTAPINATDLFPFQRPSDSTARAATAATIYSAVRRVILFKFAGSLIVSNYHVRVQNVFEADVYIESVALTVNTAPVGSAIIVDVNQDGTTVFTNQAHRPQVAAAAFSGVSTNTAEITWAEDSYIQVDIDQVGSTTPGSDMVVHVVFHG